MIDNSIKIDNDKLPDGTILFGGKYRVDECVCSEDFENTYIVRHMAFDELMIMKELSIKDLCHQYEFAQKLSSDGRSYLEKITCSIIQPWEYKGCDDLTVFIVPDGTMSICHHAFFNCRQLRFVSLPEDLETIGENAFSGCCSLTAIYIPDSVREIDIFAFEDCKSLTQVSVPSTLLDSIGKGSFAGCVSLKTFFVRDSNGIVEDITIKDEWK